MSALKLVAIAFIGLIAMLPALHEALGPDNFDAFSKWLENLHWGYHGLFMGVFWALLSIASSIKVPRGSIAIVRNPEK